MAHVRRSYQDQPDRWWRDVVNFNIVDHGVHFLDLIRHFSGRTPDAVSATTAMMQGQNAVSPLSHTLALHFDSGDLTAIDHFNNIVQSKAGQSEFWHVDGAEGSISGTPQYVEVTQRDEPERRVRFPIEGAWFPEAFGGSMGELMAALNDGREPLTSSRGQPEYDSDCGGGGAEFRRGADGAVGGVCGLGKIALGDCCPWSCSTLTELLLRGRLRGRPLTDFGRRRPNLPLPLERVKIRPALEVKAGFCKGLLSGEGVRVDGSSGG